MNLSSDPPWSGQRIIANSLFSRLCSFFGSSMLALEILKVFFVKYSFSFSERGERRGARHRDRETEREASEDPLGSGSSLTAMGTRANLRLGGGLQRSA